MAFSHLASFHGLLSPCILPWPSHTLRPHDLPRFPPPSCVHCPNDIFLEDDHRTCSDHGVCIDGVSCRCDEAWEGATCNLLRCTGPVDGCNDHGDCQNDLAPAPCTVTADGNLTDAAEGLCSNLLDDCIAAYHDCPQRGVSNQVCDLPRSPAFSRLLPPSPAFTRLHPPSPAFSHLLLIFLRANQVDSGGIVIGEAYVSCSRSTDPLGCHCSLRVPSLLARRCLLAHSTCRWIEPPRPRRSKHNQIVYAKCICRDAWSGNDCTMPPLPPPTIEPWPDPYANMVVGAVASSAAASRWGGRMAWQYATAAAVATLASVLAVGVTSR